MGVVLSCDVCEKTLSEEHDCVHEKKDEKKDGDPMHVCVECFNNKVHIGYTKRSVYAVVGEENARQMRDMPQNMQIAEDVLSGFQNTRSCVCGAETVVREGLTTCFACGKPFP